MAIGNIVRVIVQMVVPIFATIVRALPTAYAEALQNAKKTGTQEVLRRGAKTMSKSEAMQILNVTEAEVATTPEAIQRQYAKYFAANDAANGGSFYLQSKVFRAKEMLDDFIKEKEQEETKQQEEPAQEASSSSSSSSMQQPPL